ncbi:MAG: prepilin-type N-terminal cleavage/methylation domain-containing protein [Planctomycetota bacterium]
MITHNDNPIAAPAQPLRGRRVADELRNPQSAARNRRHAVTLVELLITMAILSILAAAFLGAQNAALEASRRARTKTTIAKIHTLLMEKWSDYKTARLDLQFVTLPPSATSVPGHVRADIMLDALRMTQKLEMPDRWSDILGDVNETGRPVNLAAPRSAALEGATGLLRRPLFKQIARTDLTPGGLGPYVAQLNYPDLTRTYLRRYNEIKADADLETIERFQGAECLYLIIMNGTGDGEARSLFGQRDIGDTDGDGALEFLDGWGRPIRYIRWPAGFFPSELMSIDLDLGPPPVITGDFDTDHDPFDYFRRDLPVTSGIVATTSLVVPNPILGSPGFLFDERGAYRLLPLVYSVGPDGDDDVFTSAGDVTEIDPYASIYGDNMLLIGAPGDDEGGEFGYLDNIYNHQID